MPKKLFGTSGIRGDAEILFTDEFCMRVGYCFGLWLKKQGKEGYVAMAMDPRESSPRIKSRVANGLAAAGFEILDEGVVPTPALTYFVKKNSLAGGVMITGSHITANLNGVKLLVNGEEVTKDDEKSIEVLFATLTKSILKVEPIIKFDQTAQEVYIEMLKNLATGPYPQWKIVVDTTNGAQTEIVRQLLALLNLKFSTVNDFDIQSPHFVPCDTEFPAMFADLVRSVLQKRADFGIAFDVDGDRVVFVDHQGRFIPGDYSCSLLGREPGIKSIVTPISTSSVVDSLGKKVYRTPVGSTYVSAKMKEVGSNFGFEANGGSLNPEISYGRDGGVTAIKILNLLKKSDKTLAQLYDSLAKYHLQREKVDCPFNKYAEVLAAVKTRYAHKKIDDLDGLKVYLSADDWILYRGSGNSPEFKVFAESKTEANAKKLGQEGLALVKSVITKSQTTNHSSGQDSLNVFAALAAFPDQCRQVLQEMPVQDVPASCNLVDNIVVSGMGGSALGGRILSNLERQVLRVPIVVSTEYHLPNFVSQKTLVVISSYSGNTEETLSSLNEAIAREAQIFVLASGGKLAEIAQAKHLPNYIFTPRYNSSGQPRLGLGYNLMALVALLSRCQLIKAENFGDLTEFLKNKQAEIIKISQDLVEKLAGKMPVIFASEHLKGVAHDMKNQLNENAKNFACNFDLPEANHHLLEGLTFPRTNAENLVGVFLESHKYSPAVLKRYALTQAVFTKQHIAWNKISAVGKTPFFECFYLVWLSSYLSYYLSQENGIDPGPIPWVDYFKDELAK